MKISKGARQGGESLTCTGFNPPTLPHFNFLFFVRLAPSETCHALLLISLFIYLFVFMFCYLPKLNEFRTLKFVNLHSASTSLAPLSIFFKKIVLTCLLHPYKSSSATILIVVCFVLSRAITIR